MGNCAYSSSPLLDKVRQSGHRTYTTHGRYVGRRFMPVKSQANILASSRFKWLRGGSIRTLAALVFNFTRAWMFRSVLTHLLRYASQRLPLRTWPRNSCQLTAPWILCASRKWICNRIFDACEILRSRGKQSWFLFELCWSFFR